jgi:ABC-type dipeptide/oligopeptide/nickel transport system permease subunit
MINEGQSYYLSASHLVSNPGLAVMITVLAVSPVGGRVARRLRPAATQAMTHGTHGTRPSKEKA